MKTQLNISSGLRRLAVCGSLAISGALLLPGEVNAQIVTMDNGGSTATVNLGSSAGMDNWSVGVGANMQNQLNQQWFWYSVNGGAVQSIDTIANSPGGSLSYSLSLDQSTLNATYQNSTLAVAIQYQLSGGGAGSGSADLSESITIVNTGASAFNINFFQYSFFNLLQNDQNTVNILGNPGAFTSISQTTTGGGNGIVEVVEQPFANYAEAGGPATVMADMTSGHALTDATSAGPGDEAWAFEWAATGVGTGVNNALDIYKDKNLSIQPVPEPGTMSLVGLGLVACGFVRRTMKRNV